MLAEYASFPVDIRRSKLGADKFAEVERCYAALLIARDVDPNSEKIRLEQLRQTLQPNVASSVSPELTTGVDPITDRIWWQGYMRQIFLVEKAVLDLQDMASLVTRAPFLLERFRIVVDQKVDYLKRQYDQDLANDKLEKLLAESQKKGSGKTEEETWLRGKLASLLNEIHWWYAQSQVREELFLGQQLTVLATVLLGALCLWVGWSQLASNCHDKTIVAVLTFGMLGAFTSVMRRMRSDSEQHGGGTESSFKELTAFAYGKVGITLSVVFGSIFALILMLIMEGEMAKFLFSDSIVDKILPSFPLSTSEGTTCTTACTQCLFANAANFARLAVWSFVAGFTEQLVPDALDRLTKAATPSK